jgi:hypothetical protein
MIVYDDTEPLEKLKIYDARVEVPPHYDTFAEFTYSYHYGDAYVPYIKQDEPLKLECQHFLDCVRDSAVPLTNGRLGLEVVRILEAADESLQLQGASVSLAELAPWNQGITVLQGNGNGHSNGKAVVQGNGNGHAIGNGSVVKVPAHVSAPVRASV